MRVAAAAAFGWLCWSVRGAAALHSDSIPQPKPRRNVFGVVASNCAVITATLSLRAACVAEEPAMVVSDSGLRYQDFKVGSGSFPKKGQRVTIDYVMQTSGARYGSKIDSTKDRNEPFSFKLFEDIDVIDGLQEAVSTMKSGGVRRAFIPQGLGYVNDKKQPIPPTFAEYQRFKNIYQNPNRP